MRDDPLLPLVEKIRDYQMSPAEVQEQRIAFAYGNAPTDDNSTKEEVREALLSATAPAA